MAAVMTAETRNVVCHYHTIADLELTDLTPDLDHLAGDLVT